MAVLRPLKVVIENYPEGQVEELEAVNHPDDPSLGTRKISFGRELYIERDDFMENPPKKFFRLSPGNEVRLRYAYFVKCTGVIKNDAGEVVELRCTYDPATKGGNAPDGRKVKATMHWLSAAQSVPAEIRVYNQLFANPSPSAANFAADLNPESLEVLPDARIEPSVAADNSGEVMQFERQGYFVRDRDSAPGKPVFNRTIGLRDTFAKEVGGKGEHGVGKAWRAHRMCDGGTFACPPTIPEVDRWDHRAQRDRRRRLHHHGKMGDGVRQTGCQRARIALRTQRVLLRLEPEPLSRQ